MSNLSLSDLPAHLLNPDERAKLHPVLQQTPDEVLAKAIIRNESDLQNAIEQYCRLQGWLPIRSRMDRKTTLPPGTLDFTIALPNGRTLWVECKTPAGKLSPKQEDMKARLEARGHAVYVAREIRQTIAWMKEEASK